MTRLDSESCSDCRNCCKHVVGRTGADELLVLLIDDDVASTTSCRRGHHDDRDERRRRRRGGPPAPPGPSAGPPDAAVAPKHRRWCSRAAGTVGEGGLEDALQFGGLIAGQLAAGNFAGDKVVDLRFEIGGRGVACRWPVAGTAGLHRRIDIGQRRRQRVLVGRADGAGIDFGQQLILQLLERRLVGAGRRPPRSRS